MRWIRHLYYAPTLYIIFVYVCNVYMLLTMHKVTKSDSGFRTRLQRYAKSSQHARSCHR